MSDAPELPGPDADQLKQLLAVSTRAAEQLELIAAAAAAGTGYTFALARPLELAPGKPKVEALTLRRPNAGDLLDLDLPFGGPKSYAQLLRLGARCAGHDVALLRKLDIEDANLLALAAGFFSGLGLPTGGPLSGT